MFYSEAILSRRGPLAKVWLAAHMERKLSKTQTLQTDIEKSVDAIVGQEVELMALRLSGQLLLGVVRIYSRKAKYLLDDCNDALLRIKMAFKPGIVDMTEEQLAVNKNTITLQGNDLDHLLPDLDWDQDFQYRPTPLQGQHIARRADVTLAAFDDFQMDYSGYYDLDLGPEDGIGSQDYALPLDFGPQPGEEEPVEESEAPGPEDETMSVEVGREAAPPRAPRESIDSRLFGQGRDDADVLSAVSRAVSVQPFDDFGLGAGDLTIEGLTFDDVAIPVISDREKTPGQTTRASSPLTEPPQTPPDIQATPQPVEKAKRRLKEKKAVVDEETEMPGARTGRGAGIFARNDRDISDILAQHQYLPRSALVMQLMDIRNDPLAYFMPTKVTPQGTFVYAGPPGLSGELAEMFMRPALPTPGKKQQKPPSTGKKRKVSGRESEEDEEEMERMRKRAHVPESIGVPSEALGRISLDPVLEFDTSAPVEEFQMPIAEDVPMPDVSVEQGQIPRARSASIAPSHRSRMSTPALENPPFDETEPTYADSTCPIAMFDERGAPSQVPSETEGQRDDKGYSRNTIKALGLIRGELLVEEGSAEKTMSFNEMTNKASRRAASAFFFELLLLSTKDYIGVSQEVSFENIEIRAKDKLWANQRGLSVVPASSVGRSGSQSQVMESHSQPLLSVHPAYYLSSLLA